MQTYQLLPRKFVIIVTNYFKIHINQQELYGGVITASPRILHLMSAVLSAHFPWDNLAK